MKNALECEVPFNNFIRDRKDNVIDMRYGNYKPTLWFFDTCKTHIEHFKNWRMMEWKTEQARAEHDAKRIMERWSDFCRNVEFLGSQDPIFYTQKPSEYEPRKYFSRRH